ncbi:MAG: ABC transporter permease [Oscillospiraceae bacterium]|jgi:simple sugar transport system permease protein|nr:ABC transporter permease [Oscillospiraceae bacterium]
MKRDSILSLISTLIVIIAGLLIGLIVLLVSDSNQAFPAFWTMISFGTRNMRNVGDVLLGATPIILTGLSVTFAFKTGLFNIGAAGQFAFGGFTAIYIGVQFLFLPPPLRIICSILGAALAGAVWGAIPGLLKAYRNVHEVITSIMTNYIGMYLLSYTIQNTIFDMGRTTTTRMPDDSNLPTLGLDYIFREPLGSGYRSSAVNLGIFIAILIAILVYVILDKTKFGYELKACGFNKDAAKYAGINQNKNIVFSMMICGAIAGIGGALNYMNGTGLSMTALPLLAMEGFTGISVAFLGLTNPIGVIFSGIFVSYLFLGGARMQPFGFSLELVNIVVAVIIYFCAFVLVVKTNIGKIFPKGKEGE